MLKVAADIRAAAIEEAEADALFEEWLTTVGEGVAGYVTPKVAVAAIVGNEQGELLLTQRADSGVWLYPVGWADVGYSPAEVAIKEVHEETGIEVEVGSLSPCFDGLRLGFARLPMYSLRVPLHVLGGELRATRSRRARSASSAATRCRGPSPASGRWLDTAFAAIDGETRPCDFDLPRTPPWRGTTPIDRPSPPSM